MVRFLLLAVISALFFPLFCGCCSHSRTRTAYQQAQKAVFENKASSLLICNGRILGQQKGRGLNPLLDLYDRYRPQFKGCIIVDKVIGRAAAFIAVRGNAKKVYGQIMSEPARKLLEKHGIETEWKLLVPHILNRTRDDICPLEKAVHGLDDADQAMGAIRKCVAELERLDNISN